MAQSSSAAVLDESGYLSDSSLLDSVHSSLRKQKSIAGLSHASSLMNLCYSQCLHSTPLSPLKRTTHLRKSAYLKHSKLSIIKKPEIKPRRLLMVEESLEIADESASSSLLNESDHSPMQEISKSNPSLHISIRKSQSISDAISNECSTLSDDSGFQSINSESQVSLNETLKSELLPTVDSLKTSKIDTSLKLDSSKEITKVTKLKKKLFNLEGKKYYNLKTERYCLRESVGAPPECSVTVKQSPNLLHIILQHTPGLLISVLKLLPLHDLLAFSHVCSNFMQLVRNTKCLQSRIEMLFHNQRVSVGIVGKENFCRPFKIFQPNNSSRMPLTDFNRSTTDRATPSLHCPQLQRIRPSVQNLSTKYLPEQSSTQKNINGLSNFTPHSNDAKDRAKNVIGNSSCSSSTDTLKSVPCHRFLSCFHQAANALQNAVSPRKNKKICTNKSAKCSQQLTKRFDTTNPSSNCQTDSALLPDETLDTNANVSVKALVGVKKVCAILGDENDVKPQSTAKFRPFSKATKKKLRRL